MENPKQYYQKLYIEYKELKKKTTLRANDLKSDGEIKTQHISVDDMKRKFEVQKELLNGLGFLSDDQLIELSGDHPFLEKAQETLEKRRRSK